MLPGNNFLTNLLNALLPNREAPVLGKVIRSYQGPGKNKYSVDVRVLKAGSLEETERVISEVPISPIWASRKKRGVYAIPEEGLTVIIAFLEWNPAFPYVSGIWSDEYEADEFKKDQFVITDGKGMKFIIDATDNSILLDNGKGSIARIEVDKITVDNGKGSVAILEVDKITLDNGKLRATLNADKVSIRNAGKSLFTVMNTALGHMAAFAQNTAKHRTRGSPALHVVDKDDITKFTQDNANFTQDMVELALIMEA